MVRRWQQVIEKTRKEKTRANPVFGNTIQVQLMPPVSKKNGKEMKTISEFDCQKAAEVLLYITAKVHNIYTALKIAYFADKDHLEKWGRLLCGDCYIAMRYGPVPGGLYDIVKSARGEAFLALQNVSEHFNVVGNAIYPGRAADLDWLSQSDTQCLDAAIIKYGEMDFNQLKAICQNDQAFRNAGINGEISLESIACSLPCGQELLEYLESTR